MKSLPPHSGAGFPAGSFGQAKKPVPRSNQFLPILGILLLLPLAASAATLRIEGNRAWLSANNTPLPKVLELFEQRGINVLIDPAVTTKRISGDWENTRVDRLLDQLASPHSYMVEHRRVDSPLGTLYPISTIRIFSDGNASAAKPLSSKERVLDIVAGTNGVKYLRGEIMVGFGENSSIDDLNALLRKIDGTVIEVIDPPGIYRIKLNDDLSVEEALAIASEQEGVENAEPNLAFPTVGNSSSPISGTNEGINLHLQPGETAVAVFDSGLDPQYADLPFIRGTYNALDPSQPMSDPIGHGTLTTLLASGALTPLGAEPPETGVPVLSVRTFDENGYTSSDILLRAIDYAANSGINIISMSWGSETDSAFMEAAMNLAQERGITLYAAVGNENTGQPIFPAASPGVIGVGGLDASGGVWKNSNEGDFVDEYAPAFANFEGKTQQGTSVSTPYAAFKAAQSEVLEP
jgi:hypothetical protein